MWQFQSPESKLVQSFAFESSLSLNSEISFIYLCEEQFQL